MWYDGWFLFLDVWNSDRLGMAIINNIAISNDYKFNFMIVYLTGVWNSHRFGMAIENIHNILFHGFQNFKTSEFDTLDMEKYVIWLFI